MQSFTETKLCSEFPNYGITSAGQVIHLKTGRVLKPSLVNGYPRVSLCRDGKVKNIHVHRLVASLFCEKPEGSTVVNHKDLNRENNKAENLEWCTQSKNVLHAYNEGAASYGEDSHKATITRELVRNIAHELLKDTERGAPVRIARKFNVSTDIVRQIKSRTTWVRDTADILD